MIGVDPYETKEVEIQGVKFTIGHIPYRKYLELQAALLSIDDITKVADIATEDVKNKLDTNDFLSICQFNFEIIQWGVKNHSNFKIGEKTIPFETEEVNLYGKPKKIVSEKTMEYYASNRMINDLATQITKFNTLQEEDSKNS